MTLLTVIIDHESLLLTRSSAKLAYNHHSNEDRSASRTGQSRSRHKARFPSDATHATYAANIKQYASKYARKATNVMNASKVRNKTQEWERSMHPLRPLRCVYVALDNAGRTLVTASVDAA